eukprot:1587673-Ditylum_brightwellii.AAC.1
MAKSRKPHATHWQTRRQVLKQTFSQESKRNHRLTHPSPCNHNWVIGSQKITHNLPVALQQEG